MIDQNFCVEIPTTTSNPLISTTTPMTTIPPPFVQLGIASEKETFNLCFLQQREISCPANYIITIRNYFYGISSQNKCFYTLVFNLFLNIINFSK